MKSADRMKRMCLKIALITLHWVMVHLEKSLSCITFEAVHGIAGVNPCPPIKWNGPSVLSAHIWLIFLFYFIAYDQARPLFLRFLFIKAADSGSQSGIRGPPGVPGEGIGVQGSLAKWGTVYHWWLLCHRLEASPMKWCIRMTIQISSACLKVIFLK